MEPLLLHIVVTALYFSESDGLSVTPMVPNPTTVIVVPPNNSSVTLSWNYTLNSGEQLAAIPVSRIRQSKKQDLVSYDASNPNDGVIEQFKSRMNFSIIGDEIHLVINNLVVNDGGFDYECQVITLKPRFKTVSAIIQLIVRVAAHNVSVVCDDAVLGQAMTCNCTADGDPAPTSFHWRASSGSVLGNSNSYTTPSVERTLNGSYYTCVVSNGFGPNASKNTSIFYVKGKPSSVEISPYPSVPVNETGNTTLTCKASGGNPAVYHYKWQHNGNDIIGGENGTLTLIDVQRNQTGRYSCQGCNEYGCASNSSSLIVQHKPNSVQVSPHPSVTVNETNSTALKCNASGGYPAVYHYKWQHNGNDIIGGENGTLTLIGVQRNQTGNYFCQGCNMIGCTIDATTVIVQYQPSNVSIVADPDSTVAAGKSLTLNCLFKSGNLPISFEWKLNNAPMLQQRDRSLVIEKVGISDSGTYKCTAMNILGNAAGKIDITVTPDKCVEKSCSGNGNCTIQSDGVKKCKCKEGWHGENCNTCTCNSNGSANGVCDVIDGQRICQCKDKYSGDLCELRSDEYDIVTGRFALTNYAYEDWMNDIKSNQAKQFIAMVRPLLQNGTSAKACKITKLTNGSVEIHFELFFEKGKKEEKKEAVKKFIEGGKLGNYTIKEGSLVFQGTGEAVKNRLSTEAIIIIVVVVVVLVIAIIAAVVWRVKNGGWKRK